MATSLREMTALNQFPQTEKLFKSIPAAPTGYLGPAETTTSDVEMMQAKNLARENVGKAEIGIEQARRDEKTAELTSQAELEKEFAERRKNMPEMAALKEGREKLRGMEFVPTKDNVQDIAGLFSLIGVIGMAVGGGGRMASQQAMGAMNGMMEGHRKGRADLFKKEQIEFDKNFKAMQTAVSSLKDEYSEALEIEKTDKEAGRIARAMALNKAGSPVLKAMETKQGAVNVMNTINDLDKSVKTSVTQYNTLKAKSDAEANVERRHREAMAQRDRIAREQAVLREKLAAIAASGKGQGTLKPGAKVTEGYIADNILKADVDGLVKDLSNPALQQQIKDNRIEAFLTEESKVLNQVLAKEIPPELQQFLTKVRDIRNNYYLNISGKAVTGGEALRNYGTVPQPGDEPSVMVNKLAGMSGRISDSITLKKQLFGLPNLSLNPGTKPNLKPGEDYAVGSQPGTYELNQVITLGGKKYKVIGLDDPSDPDLEEIK